MLPAFDKASWPARLVAVTLLEGFVFNSIVVLAGAAAILALSLAASALWFAKGALSTGSPDSKFWKANVFESKAVVGLVVSTGVMTGSSTFAVTGVVSIVVIEAVAGTLDEGAFNKRAAPITTSKKTPLAAIIHKVFFCSII